MKRLTEIAITLLMVAAAVGVFACVANGQEEREITPLEAVTALAKRGINMSASEPRTGWYWTHSAVGSPPARYQIEWDVGGIISVIDSIAVGDTTFAEIDLPYTWGTYQLVRVRAFDAENRPSIYSPWSDPWFDSGPPGQPPKPQATLKMVEP